MAEAGQIARGTVVRILAYGALVRLDDGCLGLVHISEIDERYVKEVGEYLREQTRVVVKVLQEKEGGRWEFSIKAAKGALPP
jgi:S1 RNA binding domain protein